MKETRRELLARLEKEAEAARDAWSESLDVVNRMVKAYEAEISRDIVAPLDAKMETAQGAYRKATTGVFNVVILPQVNLGKPWRATLWQSTPGKSTDYFAGGYGWTRVSKYFTTREFAQRWFDRNQPA